MSKRVVAALLYVAVAVTAFAVLASTGVLDLQSVQAHRDALLAHVAARPTLSLAVFVAVYVAVTALSLPAASILTLVGGFLFGPFVGTAAVVVGATLGASIVFLIARTSLGAGLRAKAGSLRERIAVEMRADAFSYLLFLRLVPAFPFFLVNIVPALFDVRLRTFVLATVIGIVPGSFVYANLGRELGTIASTADLVSPQLFVAFVLLGLISLVPIAVRRWRMRAVDKNKRS